MLFAINVCLALLVAAMTLLPLSRYPAWWVRDLDFPRLQIAIFALAVLLEQAATMDLHDGWALLIFGLTLACLVYQGAWILPYTWIYPNEVKAAGRRKDRPEQGAKDEPGPGRESSQGCSDENAGTGETAIRILSANVLSPNRNAAGLIALIRQHQPDLFVTLESDHWWEEQLTVLEAEYRFAIKCPLENLYGMHVYSRLPLEDAKTQFLVQPGIPSMHAMVSMRSGQKVRMHFLHPAPPSPTENDESTERDAELLIVAKSVASLDTPVIVAGDLNDVAWSRTTRLFRKISGLLDPRIGRGMFNTFHAQHWFMRWPLDHFFHSRHFTLSFIRRLPEFGSDHFPVMVELIYDERNGMRQEGLAADESDEAFAEEKIKAEAVSAADVHEPRA